MLINRKNGRTPIFSVLDRKSKSESGAFSQLTFHINTAFVTFDNSFNHGQAETQTLTFTLGGEEGLENVRQVSFADATSCVSYLDGKRAVI